MVPKSPLPVAMSRTAPEMAAGPFSTPILYSEIAEATEESPSLAFLLP